MRILNSVGFVLACAVLSACGGSSSGEGPAPVYSPNAKYGKGAQQEVTLFEPTGVAKGLAVWIHGGGWVSGDKDDDLPFFASLPSMGIAVLNVNYRLGAEGAFPKSVDDIRTVLATLEGKPCADCTNTEMWSRAQSYAKQSGYMVAGASAGGYLAIFAGADHVQNDSTSKLKCIVGQVPPVDFRPLESYSAGFTKDFLSVLAGGDLSPAKMAAMSPAVRLEQGSWQNAMSRKWYLFYSTPDEYIPFATTAGFSNQLTSNGAKLTQVNHEVSAGIGGHNVTLQPLANHLTNSAASCFGNAG